MTDGSIVPAVVKSSSGDGSDDRIYDVEYITRKIGCHHCFDYDNDDGNGDLNDMMVMMVEIIPWFDMSHLVAH